MSDELGSTQSLAVFNLARTGSDLHATVGLYARGDTGHLLLDGSVDDDPAPDNPQGFYPVGKVGEQSPDYTGGDACVFHFNTKGALLVDGFSVAEGPDDDAIAIGGDHQITVPLNYFSNLDNASIWERWTGRDDDGSLATGDASPTVLPLLHIYNRTNNAWERLYGADDNGPAGATPNGVFTVGIAETGDVAFTAADAVVPRNRNKDGALVVANRQDAPAIVGTTQASIAASGSFVLGPEKTQNFWADTCGLYNLSLLVHYAGTASSVTALVEVSLDSGATWVAIRSYTVLSGVALVVESLRVPFGDNVRVTLTNNDGANATGVTNAQAVLTK